MIVSLGLARFSRSVADRLRLQRARRRSHAHLRTFGVEKLEDRTLLSAAMSATIDGSGDLVVTDDGSNTVGDLTIEASPVQGYVRVQGNNQTTVANGGGGIVISPDAVDFAASSITANVEVTLAGTNTVELNGTNLPNSNYQVPDDLDVTFTDPSDPENLLVQELNVGGSFNVNPSPATPGNGVTTIEVNDVNVGINGTPGDDYLVFFLGNGNNVVAVANTNVASSMDVEAGNGNNDIDVLDGVEVGAIGGGLLLSAGNGNNSVLVGGTIGTEANWGFEGQLHPMDSDPYANFPSGVLIGNNLTNNSSSLFIGVGSGQNCIGVTEVTTQPSVVAGSPIIGASVVADNTQAPNGRSQILFGDINGSLSFTNFASSKNQSAFDLNGKTVSGGANDFRGSLDVLTYGSNNSVGIYDTTAEFANTIPYASYGIAMIGQANNRLTIDNSTFGTANSDSSLIEVDGSGSSASLLNSTFNGTLNFNLDHRFAYNGHKLDIENSTFNGNTTFDIYGWGNKVTVQGTAGNTSFNGFLTQFVMVDAAIKNHGGQIYLGVRGSPLATVSFNNHTTFGGAQVLAAKSGTQFVRYLPYLPLSTLTWN